MPETLATKVLVGSLLFLFGAVVTHLWTRFRGRLVTLSWTATGTRLAVRADDTGYGRVEVFYNGHPVNNLHLISVALRNESTKDLTNILVNLAFLEGSEFVISEGTLIGSLTPITIDAGFMTAWLALSDQNPIPPEVRYYQTRRNYPIPVFNRGAVARFDILSTRSVDNNNPAVSVAVDHPGVQVKNRPPVTETLGVPDSRAQLIGILLAIAVTIAVVVRPLPAWVVGTVSLVVGLTAIILGALAVLLVRGISRILS